MALFDVKKYETPSPENVDMERTKYNVGVFLSAYLSARTRVGQPREPKITSSFSLVPPSFSNQTSAQAEDILIQNEDAKEEFYYLNDLFERGFSTVQHPFKPEISNRRKQVFYDRYILGKSIYVVAQSNHISEETVKQDSIAALVQFCEALGILVLKE